MSKKKHHSRAKYANAVNQKQSKDGAKGDEIWDILAQQSLDSLGVLTSCAAANGFARNHDLMRMLNPEQSAVIVKAYSDLAAKTKELVDNLSRIRAVHSSRTGSSVSTDDFNKAIIINNQYLQWHDDWQTSVLPLLETITTIFAEVEGLVVKANPEAETNPDASPIVLVPKEAPTFFDTASADARDAKSAPVLATNEEEVAADFIYTAKDA